jgi:hypothetical protein
MWQQAGSILFIVMLPKEAKTGNATVASTGILATKLANVKEP